MGGLSGIVSQADCVADLYYGTDYHSHLGTKRGGMAVRNDHGFHRAIHNIENSYFRSKFESELHRFHGRQGIGVISDTDPQPLIIGSHLGTFGIVTVGRINNMEALIRQAYHDRRHFSGTSDGISNPTEVTAMLISQEDSFEAGICRAQELIEGSCTLLLLTERGIYAARDRLGRTPLVVGRRDGATAVSSETCAFPNLDFTTDHFLRPGEVLRLTADGWEQLLPPGPRLQICSFLWVYYGYPASEYEGLNVEQVRYDCGAALGRHDRVEVDVVAGIPDSGIGHALGYANERNLPYNRPFVKYTPTWPRSFLPQEPGRARAGGQDEADAGAAAGRGPPADALRRLHCPRHPTQGQRPLAVRHRRPRGARAARLPGPDLPLRVPQLLHLALHPGPARPQDHPRHRGRRGKEPGPLRP